MSLEDIIQETWSFVNGVSEPNLYKFSFADCDGIMLVPVKADNLFSMSAIQVWKLVETYQINEDGSLSKT